MTHPSDIAGLSERLREIRGKLTLDIDREWLATIDEAATALDSLELVRSLESRATSAEAYERAAKWHDDKVEQLSRWASEKPSDSRAIAAGAGINMHRASAAAIRRLASGPEGGSVKMEGK